MRPTRVTRRTDQRGAALVEFVFVLPILIVLLFGIIQFGIAFNRVQGLHAAAREGARVASLPTTTSGQISTRVNAALGGINYDATPSVSVSPGTCAGRSGQQVTVTVQAPYTIDIPLLPSTTVNLEGRGVFRCE